MNTLGKWVSISCFPSYRKFSSKSNSSPRLRVSAVQLVFSGFSPCLSASVVGFGFGCGSTIISEVLEYLRLKLAVAGRCLWAGVLLVPLLAWFKWCLHLVPDRNGLLPKN